MSRFLPWTIAVMAMFLAGFAQAANQTWNNTGTDFNAPGSWNTSGPAPGSGDVALFNVSATTQPNLSSSGTIQGLNFSTGGASGYTLTSSNPSISLTLTNVGTGATGAINSAINSGTNIISAPLILGAASGSTQTFTQGSGGTIAVSGAIASTNSVNLSFAGGGTWILNGINTYTGTTTQSSSGVIVVGNKAAFSNTVLSLQGGGRIQAGVDLTGANKITNNIVMGANVTILDSPGFGIEFGGTVDLGGAARTITGGNSAGTTFGGVISNDGGLGLTISATNGSLVTLSATNTYTGTTTIQGTGTVSVALIGNSGSNGNLGAGTVIRLGNGVNSGNLVYTGAGETTSKTFNLGGTTGGALIDQSGSGTLTFTSGTATGSGNKTLTLQGSTAGVGEISGRIMNGGSGTTSVVKEGTGTWIISGSNSYTGGTTVNAGTLLINGSLANTAVSVSGEAVLGGSGTIGGAISLTGSSVLAPGNSPGVLTVTNSVTMSGNTTLSMEISGTTAGSFDQLVLTGASSDFTLSGGQVALALSLGYTPLLGDTFTLIDLGAGVFSGAFGNLNPLGTVNVGAVQFTANDFGVTSNDLILTVTAVPEPQTLLLLGLGASTFLWRRRSR